MTSASMTFTVPEISCQHCVTAITEEVTAVDGVTQVHVDIGQKTVTVTGGDDQLIVAAIDEAGYEVAGRTAA